MNRKNTKFTPYFFRLSARLFFLCFLLTTDAQAQDFKPEALVKDFDAKIATDWYELILSITKDSPGFSPPVASRAFAYIGIALYESLLPGMPEYQSLSGQLNGLKILSHSNTSQSYHWPTVANAAIAYMVKNLYVETHKMVEVKELEHNFNTQFSQQLSGEVFYASLFLGQTIATDIFEWSKTDGGHEGYLNDFSLQYIPPAGEGMWVPTPPDFDRALQPYWGNNRPFLTANVSHSQPKPHTAFSVASGSSFYAQALEVYNVLKNLSAEQYKIAHYWSDDVGKSATPPGHSLSILIQLIKKEKLGLDKAAEALAKLGISLSDAFVSCWKTKYVYCLMRPITYIRDKMNIPKWHSLLNTPPFPEYTSGHSVQAGAASVILTQLFGNKYAFTDRTHQNRTDIDGSPRSFSSFEAMAAEAAISRLYAGIHYREAIDLGIIQGKKIGNNIINLKFLK